MIVEEVVVAAWRFYDTVEARPYQDFDGICTVIYLTKKTVCVKGLLAVMSRDDQRKFIEFCQAKGIERIYADRSPARSLPMARRLNDMNVIDIQELIERFKIGERFLKVPPDPNNPNPKRRASDKE